MDSLLASQKIFGIENYEKNVSFGILGGTEELQIFCQNLGTMFDTKPETIKNSKFTVYLVPFKKSAIAKMVAKLDIWYARYIYSAFIEDTFLPRVSGA